MSTRYAPERLASFIRAALEAQGVKPEHAFVTAERMVEADLRGRSGHGVIRLPQYSKRLEAGGYNLDPDIRVLRETPVSALVDGDNGFGHAVVTTAMELAIEKAETSGIGFVGTVRSNHAGAAGVYPAMALRRDLIGMYFAVANGNGLAPWGGRERLLGTNPIAVAIPAGSQPAFQLDIATTVASHGTIKVTAQAGEQMPEGWVVDDHGNPITDPRRASEGYLVPIGGYKGAGLNFMIGALAGIMTGAAFGREVVDFQRDHATPTNTGQAMLVMRSDLFMDVDEFKQRMDHQLREFHESESMTDEPIRLPGDRAVETEEENRRLGIELRDSLVAQLQELADRLGLDVSL